MGLPFQPFYSAAKFAVEGFSEALRMEVQSFNIRVVVINPGDFRTNNSANRRKYLAPAGEGDPYAAHSPGHCQLLNRMRPEVRIRHGWQRSWKDHRITQS